MLALHVLCLLCSFNEVFIFTTLRAKECACMYVCVSVCVCDCVCVCVCALFIEGAENEGPPLFMFANMMKIRCPMTMQVRASLCAASGWGSERGMCRRATLTAGRLWK